MICPFCDSPDVWVTPTYDFYCLNGSTKECECSACGRQWFMDGEEGDDDGL
jgi:hypothetical protein